MIQIPVIHNYITKEFLLSKNSQETYMETYLGIPVKKGLQISPLRKDKKPTASFYVNPKGDLIFHDFGTGFHGNFIKVVMEIYNVDYYTAMKIIASDFNYCNINSINIIRKPPKIIISNTVFKEKKDTYIQVEIQDFTKEDIKWWNSFGISEQTLKKYRVVSCKNIFINGQLAFMPTKNNPAYGYYGGKKNNIELWRIYFPKQKRFRFLSNWNSKLIQGIWQLNNSNHVFVTKSLKDTMLLNEYNINACAPNGESIILLPQQYNRLKNVYKNIIVFYDNDKAGIENALKYKEKYNCKCIIIKQEYAKDISDLYKKVGKTEFEEVKKELIDISLNKLNNFKYFSYL